MSSLFVSSLWSQKVNAIDSNTATLLGPKALHQIQTKYHQQQQPETTDVLKQRLQWAKDTPYLRLNSDPIPDGILPKEWKGTIHEIKVNPRGYGKKKGAPTDDAVYENEEKVRRLVPRGCCFVELHMLKHGENDHEGDKDDKDKYDIVILPGIFAMRKFSGGLGDEDDDRGNKPLLTAESATAKTTKTTKTIKTIKTIKTTTHDHDRWATFFTRPYDDAHVVVSAKKANGEAAHASCIRLPNQQLLTICGSKHVHLAFTDPAQIQQYHGTPKYTLASIVASTFIKTKAYQDLAFLTFLADTGMTACFEIEQPTSMHVEMFNFQQPRLQFLAFTAAEIGTASGDFVAEVVVSENVVSDETKTSCCTTKNSVGQCLPPVYGFELAKSFGLSPVPWIVRDMSKVATLIHNIRKRHGDEGDVLYFMTEDGETIGLVKVKTVWYVIARAIREKLRTMISKSTKIQAGKPVKGFFPVKKNKGSQWKAPTENEILQKLCLRTMSLVSARLLQLQEWLKFNDATLNEYNIIGKSFIQWTMNKFLQKELVLHDVASIYPVLWSKHLKEQHLSDQVMIGLVAVNERVEEMEPKEEPNGEPNGERKGKEEDEEDEEDEEALSSTLIANPDFETIIIEEGVDVFKVLITTKVAPVHFTPLFEDAWTGSHVWDCSIMLSKYLISKKIQLRNRHIIEIGAGVGLVSVVCSMLQTKHVVCTDQEMLVNTIQANQQANHISAEKMTVIPLKWKDTEEKLKHVGVYDTVLVSDCLNPVYGDDNVYDLAHALSVLLHNDKIVCYIAYEERSGEDGESLSLYDLMVASLKGAAFQSDVVHVDETNMKSIYRIRRVGSSVTL
jgi:predicted nicotinamide N-methyase